MKGRAEFVENHDRSLPHVTVIGTLGKPVPVHERQAPARGELREALLEEQPGRFSGWEPPPKPTAEETPYRSRVYVTANHSADGNDYAKDEPVPEVEARRQALLLDGDEDAMDRAVVRAGVGTLPPTTTRTHAPHEACAKCEGRGTRMAGHGPLAGHKPNCPGCRLCNVCKGTGIAPVEGS